MLKHKYGRFKENVQVMRIISLLNNLMSKAIIKIGGTALSSYKLIKIDILTML